MDLRHLEYFVAVAEEKSFSRAALRLNMAQPPLSTQIKALEEELGTKLFDRLSRGVALTALGNFFLDEAKSVLSHVRQARTNLRLAAAGIAGRIAIGIAPPIANDLLAQFLREFRRRHPQVELDVHEMHSALQAIALREERLDVGFMRAPVNEPDFDHRFVSEEPMILAVPSNCELARHKRVEWKWLKNQPLILLDMPYAATFNNQFLDCCRHAGVTPTISQGAHSVHMNMWLVSAGFGIAPATHSLRYVGRPNLSFCDLPKNAPLLTTLAVWRKNNASPAVKNMIGVIQEILHSKLHPVGRTKSRYKM